MAVTLSSLRTDLRLMTKDTDASPSVEEGTLDLCINQAIQAHTIEVPYAAEHEYTTAVGVHEFDLPDGFVEAGSVYGTFVSGRYQFIEEVEYDSWMGYWKDTQEPIGFRVNHPSHGKLYLPRAPLVEPITLYYYGRLLAVLADADDEVDFLDREWSEEAVLTYAAYRCFHGLSAARARLEQWAMKIDQNVDNPLQQESDRWLAEYKRIVDQNTQIGSYGFG